MKAWWAEFDGSEWGILVHGETEGKAKSRFFRCNPERPNERGDFPYIRVRRVPKLDDKQFTRRTLDDADFHFTTEVEEDPDSRWFVNDCDCDLCRNQPVIAQR